MVDYILMDSLKYSCELYAEDGPPLAQNATSFRHAADQSITIYRALDLRQPLVTCKLPRYLIGVSKLPGNLPTGFFLHNDH
jgi:hypothetical protein